MRNKTIPFILAMLNMLVYTFNSNAQTNVISFGYDNCGNRITRSIILKSSKDNKNEKENHEFSDELGDYRITVYPNPVKNNLSVSIEGIKEGEKAGYTLFDGNGRIIQTNKSSSGHFLLEMEGLPAGIYFLNLSISGNEKQYKVIKE